MDSSQTDSLIRRAAAGDQAAVDRLFAGHRKRLRQMVALRLDPRVSRRIDPSDVVQEAFLEASRRLPKYLAAPAMPFYPWLRQIAWDRLIDLHREHIQAKRRSVTRETPLALGLSDGSAAELAKRLASLGGLGPPGQLLRKELQHRVREAIGRLSDRDREVLTLRQLEQLSVAEAAAVLGITQSALKLRHLRAFQRFKQLLEGSSLE